MKTVVRNREEEIEVSDTWYSVITEDENASGETNYWSLYKSEEAALASAYSNYRETVYIAEIKLITKVVG